MAFFDVVGELFGFGGKTWRMTVIDSASDLKGKSFEGQFIAQEMEEEIGSFLGENTTVNKGTSNFQWIRGEPDAFSFVSRVFATDGFKNVRQKIELLKSLAKRDPKLKRAPKIRFEAGTEIAFICFIRGIKFSYDELRSDGSLRGAVVSFELQKLDIATDLPKAASDLAKQIKLGIGVVAGAVGIIDQLKPRKFIPGGSLHTIGRTRKVTQGDTFESIAADEYGDALLGDILRRLQPEIVNLVPGDEVELVESAEINTIPVTPQSVALKNTTQNLELRQIKLDARNRPTVIFV